MQWMSVCAVVVLLLMYLNWRFNSRKTFTGPLRLNDVPDDTYYFLCWEYTPEWYRANYPHLVFEADEEVRLNVSFFCYVSCLV